MRRRFFEHDDPILRLKLPGPLDAVRAVGAGRGPLGVRARDGIAQQLTSLTQMGSPTQAQLTQVDGVHLPLTSIVKAGFYAADDPLASRQLNGATRVPAAIAAALPATEAVISVLKAIEVGPFADLVIRPDIGVASRMIKSDTLDQPA